MSNDRPDDRPDARPAAALTGPVVGTEPDFLKTVPMDNAVGAIVALSAELYILRERLQALEAELAARKVLPAGAVENHAPTPEGARARQADLDAFTHRILSELARDRVPTSSIDPDVGKYLRTIREIRGG